MNERLPPVHEIVRFWYRSEEAILDACVKFRKTPLPTVTLGWLRDVAPVVMTRGMSKLALRRAVRSSVDPLAHTSILNGVELFYNFAVKHQWKGNSVPASAYWLPSGDSVKAALVGRYRSEHTKSEWAVALQPRQENIPDDIQFCMWRSVLFYEFCNNNDNVMVVDISKSPVSNKRVLREVTARKFPLLPKGELDMRLDLIRACYRRAIEIVPERPRFIGKKKESEPDFGF